MNHRREHRADEVSQMAKLSKPEPQPREAGSGGRLKDAIDRGRTGDKVPGFDPGAAPLGTDEEAAGQGISTSRENMERPHAAGAAASADPSGTDRSGYRAQDRLVWPAIGAVVILIAAIAAVLGLS
jgi:hypothetical protein